VIAGGTGGAPGREIAQPAHLRHACGQLLAADTVGQGELAADADALQLIFAYIEGEPRLRGIRDREHGAAGHRRLARLRDDHLDHPIHRGCELQLLEPALHHHERRLGRGQRRIGERAVLGRRAALRFGIAGLRHLQIGARRRIRRLSVIQVLQRRMAMGGKVGDPAKLLLGQGQVGFRLVDLPRRHAHLFQPHAGIDPVALRLRNGHGGH
jgi:hypothetical protein